MATIPFPNTIPFRVWRCTHRAPGCGPVDLWLCGWQVGSDDFDLRVFRDEDMVAEVPEADQFVALCGVHLSRFGCAHAGLPRALLP